MPNWTTESEPSSTWTSESDPDYDDQNSWRIPTALTEFFLTLTEWPELNVDPEDISVAPDDLFANADGWTVENPPS